MCATEIKVSYRIVSYRVVSCRISYRVVSCRVASHRIASHRIVSYRILSYLIVSYLILSYLIYAANPFMYTSIKQQGNSFSTLLNNNRISEYSLERNDHHFNVYVASTYT